MRRSGDLKVRAAQSPGKKCFACQRTGHMIKDCPHKSESTGGYRNRTKGATTRQVQSTEAESAGPESSDPLAYLYSLSEEEEEPGVRQVRVSDHGSKHQCVKVRIQRVPAYGIIDSGADITIIGGGLFRKVAAAARLKNGILRRRTRSHARMT